MEIRRLEAVKLLGREIMSSTYFNSYRGVNLYDNVLITLKWNITEY
jgi:hypothetical protein